VKRKLTSRGRERRSQILAESARLFAERGYHPTSVAEIVESLGVGKGVFYWYFESKEDLFLEILASSSQDLRRLQQAAIGDEPDPLRRIELGIRASLQWFRDNRHLFNLSQFAATQERFATVLRQNDAVAIDDITRHLKEAMANGAIPDQDPEMLAHALVGATRHLARTYLYHGDSPVEAVADVAVQFVIGGLTTAGSGEAEPAEAR
jgi:AcrR family transcriptional regulator